MQFADQSYYEKSEVYAKFKQCMQAITTLYLHVYCLNILRNLVRAILTEEKTSVALELLLNRHAILQTLPHFAFSLSLGDFEL